jgi:hypothetical protein
VAGIILLQALWGSIDSSLCREGDVRLLAQAVFNRMQEKTHKSELADKWDRIFRDICREIVCPPALVEQDNDGRHLEVGWQRDAAGLDESGVLHAEFLNDAEDDNDAATMLGSLVLGLDLVVGLDLEETGRGDRLATGIGDRLSAVHATDSDSSMFFEKSGGFHSRETLDEVFELGDPDKIGEDQMLSTMGESSIDDRWDFAPYALSGILERILCEPNDGFCNVDLDHPSDSFTYCLYGGPWRRRFGTALRLLSLTLISVWGAAAFVFLAGESVWSTVTKDPSIGFALQCVAGVVFLAGVLELIGLIRRNRFVRLLLGRR